RHRQLVRRAHDLWVTLPHKRNQGRTHEEDHRFTGGSNIMKRLLIPIAMIVSMVGLIVGPASASTNALTVIYKSTVTPLPANLPSVGPEAYSFNEFGDEITFAATPRNVKKVIVTLSSWGCQTGHWNTADCSTTPGA